MMISQLFFIMLLLCGIILFTRKVRQIRKNILLGREESRNDRKALRRKNLFLLALGQKKMFRNPLVAVMHFIIYAGFIIINIEVLEIVLDGILGTHRLFQKPMGIAYHWLINSFEFLAVGVITVCVVFLIRRNILRIKRFTSRDLDGWPRSDANYILIAEIILMSLFLVMNATDSTVSFFFSSRLHPVFDHLAPRSLERVEKGCWWLHIAGIFAFLNYLPYSKHFHIILAFPNAYYANLAPPGKMKNMPEVRQEVLNAMEPGQNQEVAAEPQTQLHFGARDIFDLSWKNLLDAYSCTECGRCSAACPANNTGKLLSPRTIMMQTRDRTEAVGENIRKNGVFKDDGKTLLGDYIREEELRACTTCNACVEECPVSISPLDIILQLRRYLIMEQSAAPPEWNTMFGNIENNFAPWKFSPEDRDQWTGPAGG